MPSIKYLLDWDGKAHKLDLHRTQREFKKYGNAVIKEMRKILQEEGKNASGNLSKTMSHRFVVGNRFFELVFDLAPYWDYVASGVQGKVSNKKAPYSPYKFGTGTAPKGKLVPAIDKWTVVKPIKAVRDKKGRFIPRKQLVRAISRNIYMHGIQPTPFVRQPMHILLKKHQKKVSTAFASDVWHFYKKELPLEFEIQIDL
jgi:hypothetical protein